MVRLLAAETGNERVSWRIAQMGHPHHTEHLPRQRIVTIVHGVHRWRFVCDRGDEPVLIATALTKARAHTPGLDLVDVAILARELIGQTGTTHKQAMNQSAEGTTPASLTQNVNRTEDHASDE